MFSYKNHMINRKDLALLRAMYQYGTVTAAATSVHMTQPAASTLLREIETRLGFTLFSRESRRLNLTHQGRTLIPEVLNAMAGIEAVEQLSVNLRQEALTRLVVGAVPIAAYSLLPAALASMNRRHPKVNITLRAGTAMELVEMATDHRIDLGLIIGEPIDGKRLNSEQLTTLYLYAVMRPDHLWAARTDLTLHEVAGSAPIVLASSLPAGRATKDIIDAENLPYRPIIEVAQSSAACALAAEGLGVAIVESLGAHYAEKRGLIAHRLVPLNNVALTLMWSTDRAMSAAAETLKCCLKKSSVQLL
ncbi:LysR family transcriptional regulator [Advenella incenata]|uniref:LysR family transcriptional regulator n=1 Tax=Advenella incenata TaxID=267800 RepID=A0A4V2FTK1_9BURK|nr:LysR family transcriptional regulator [Advenella incenata]RZT98305.1 LysR family transcriptional regulator [Advenella incenata]